MLPSANTVESYGSHVPKCKKTKQNPQQQQQQKKNISRLHTALEATLATQYYSESWVRFEFWVCNISPFFQIEELKNDNALLRAQLQQHGIEVNGDATPQWHPTRTCATSQTRRRRHDVASCHPPTRNERQFPTQTGPRVKMVRRGAGEEHWRTETGDLGEGEDTLRSVNRVANWTSHLRFKGKKKQNNDLCTAAPRSTKRSFHVNLWTCRHQFTFNCHLSHRTSNAYLFLLLFSIFFFFWTFAVLETTKCDMNDSSRFLFNLLDFKKCVNIRRKADIGIYSCCKNNKKKKSQ